MGTTHSDQPLPQRIGQRRRQLHSDLRNMMIDVAMYGVMVGAGEAYFQAFAVENGASDTVAGLVATIPLLGGALLQLITPRGVAWAGSYRKWVVACACIQALAFVPLVIGALLGHIPAVFIFLVATVYWGGAYATGPAWMTWVGSIVPKPIKSKFFAKHARLVQITIVMAMLATGFAIQWGEKHGHALLLYAVFFLVAIIARFISAGALFRQSEPLTPAQAGHRVLSLREVLRHFIPHRSSSVPSSAVGDIDEHNPKRYEGRALVYFLAMMAAVQIANPFIAPFLLKQLNTPVHSFTILLAVVFVAKAIMLPICGGLAKKYGPMRLLWVGGIAVIPLPLLWMVSHEFWFLIIIQIVTGIAAAMYEFGLFLLILETIHERDRTSVMTIFKFAEATAGIGGSLLGGWLLWWGGENILGYYIVFGVSTAMRLLAILLLIRLSGIRLIALPLVIRAIGVRIGLGSIDRPMMDD